MSHVLWDIAMKLEKDSLKAEYFGFNSIFGSVKRIITTPAALKHLASWQPFDSLLLTNFLVGYRNNSCGYCHNKSGSQSNTILTSKRNSSPPVLIARSTLGNFELGMSFLCFDGFFGYLHFNVWCRMGHWIAGSEYNGGFGPVWVSNSNFEV